MMTGRGEDMACAVGPEGGFTEEEVALAQQAGWRVVGLGNRILRVETAALAMAVAGGAASARPVRHDRQPDAAPLTR